MRSRLVALVGATMALVLAAFLVPLAVLVRDAAEDRAVGQAISEAQSLAALVATADRDALRLSVDQLNASARFPVTVFLPDDTVLGQPAVRTPATKLAMRGRSFSVRSAAGREILLAVGGLPAGTAVIRSFVPAAELHRGVTRVRLALVALATLLLALGIALADRLAAGVVRPIGELSDVSRRLAAGDLEARAGATAGPPEVRGVAVALNHLAARIRELLQQERETAADLSHRVRTPLTALRLEAESLPNRTEARRLTAMVTAVDEALSAAIESTRRPPEPGGDTCDAAAAVSARVAFWTVLAEDQDRAVEIDVADRPVPVALPAADLAACVDALIGNVFAHTPDGTRFAVRLGARQEGGATLVVEDDGPGFGAGALVRGASGAGSTGLGLDIVRAAAARCGGTLAVDAAPNGGARVTVHLGGRAAAC